MPNSTTSMKFSNEEKSYIRALKDDALNQRKNQYKFVSLLLLTRYEKYNKAGLLVKKDVGFHGPQNNSVSGHIKKEITAYMVANDYDAKCDTFMSKCYTKIHQLASKENLTFEGSNGASNHKALDFAGIKKAINPEKGEPTIIIDITTPKKTVIDGDPNKFSGTLKSKKYTVQNGKVIKDDKGKPVIYIEPAETFTSLAKVSNVTQADAYIKHWEAQAESANKKVTDMKSRLNKKNGKRTLSAAKS